MKATFSRFLALLLTAAALLTYLPHPAVNASESDAQPVQARDISESVQITEHIGFTDATMLINGSDNYAPASKGDQASLTLESPEPIGSLYILFEAEYGTYTLTDNATGKSITCGEDRFLHEYIDVESAFGAESTSLTLNFDRGSVRIAEIVVYSPGQVPASVQRWNHPTDGRTDLVLFSTHGDDEHLFFAGILPYYAVEMGLQVQVVYLTNHWNNDPERVHEMLNGLWAVGIRNYPVLGHFPDFYCTTKHDAFSHFTYWKHSRDNLIEWVTEQLRRFKPLVTVGHDFYGEYGHGQHMAYADVVAAALEVSNDPEKDPESAEKYGTWDVPKAYFHLYQQNRINIDWDTPMENFGGMTPFQVSKQLGFGAHVSQHDNFNWWIKPHETAAAIPSFNPCIYGLYRSTVGEDVAKNDFFENLTTYTELDRIAAEEEASRLAEEQRKEAERLAAEEEARRQEEAQRLAAEEEARRQEEARLQAELEAAMAQEAARRRNLTIAISAAAVLVVCTVILILLRKRKKHS